MQEINIPQQRLHNLGLTSNKFKSPSDVIKSLGAVQSQDYPSAKWAIHLRTNLSEEKIESAISTGKILRTHVMRPTWHFLANEDIRWMLELTSPRVQAISSSYYKKMNLSPETLNKTIQILKKSLKGKSLVRSQIKEIFESQNIKTNEMRLVFILMNAELEGVICSGAKQGKHQTYALIEERAPNSIKLSNDQSLAKLLERYFSSHGPATLQDFVWLSGLKISDAKRGFELLKGKLQSAEIEGKTYFFKELHPVKPSGILLLPNYDEYFSYKDRSMYFEIPIPKEHLIRHIIIRNGKIIGAWNRKISGKNVLIETKLFVTLNKLERLEIERKVEECKRFFE